MARAAGWLFGPGLPPAGVAVELEFERGVLEISAARVRLRRIEACELRLRRAGFNDRHLELSWRDAQGVWACQVIEPAAAAALLAAWPAEFAPALAGLRAARARRVLPWAVLAVVIALPLLLLVLLLLKPDGLIDFVAARIPPAVESRVGEVAMAQVRAGTKIEDSGTQWQALQAVANRVQGDGSERYRFHLAQDDAINAFALPGGDIVVNRGLLAATRNPDELAGVLAHEVQHVAMRHSLKALIRTAGVTVLWSLLIGDPSATLAGQAADRLLALKFSRDAERAADAGGFALLVDRRIDPRGMVDFFATLAKRNSVTPPALLSTHPASADREAALAARLESTPAGCCKALTVDGEWPPQ